MQDKNASAAVRNGRSVQYCRPRGERCVLPHKAVEFVPKAKLSAGSGGWMWTENGGCWKRTESGAEADAEIRGRKRTESGAGSGRWDQRLKAETRKPVARRWKRTESGAESGGCNHRVLNAGLKSDYESGGCKRTMKARLKAGLEERGGWKRTREVGLKAD